MKVTTAAKITALVLLISPNSYAQQCEPCPNGENPLLDVNPNCRNLVDETSSLSASSSLCSNSQLAVFQLGCCLSAPLNACTLCPSGASFSPTKVVPVLDTEDVTCADLNGDKTFLSYIGQAGSCADTLLQRSAYWCGCPGEERECSLCPDGSPPPYPQRRNKVFNTQLTCNDFDFVSTFYSADECDDLFVNAYDFDAPSFCDCPNSPPPNGCELCPEGQEVVNPMTDLDSGNYQCQDLAESLKFVSIEKCVDLWTVYRTNGFVDTCCGVRGSAAAHLSIPVSFSMQTLLMIVWLMKN